MSSFPNIDPKFDSLSMSVQVPQEQWGEYKKWVRFYLHYCGKYRHNSADIGSISPFLDQQDLYPLHQCVVLVGRGDYRRDHAKHCRVGLPLVPVLLAL